MNEQKKLRADLQNIQEQLNTEFSKQDVGVVTIPDSIEYIGEETFKDTGEKFIIQCSTGTFAEDYARKHKLRY